MRVKQLEGSTTMQKNEKKIQVYVALKGEVCVRTDLVRSVTTDLKKQAVRSDQACCSRPVVFNEMIKKNSSLTTSPCYSFFLLLTLFLCYQQGTIHN